jgi:hypothetical protein
MGLMKYFWALHGTSKAGRAVSIVKKFNTIRDEAPHLLYDDVLYVLLRDDFNKAIFGTTEIGDIRTNQELFLAFLRGFGVYDNIDKATVFVLLLEESIKGRGLKIRGKELLSWLVDNVDRKELEKWIDEGWKRSQWA